MSAPIGGYDNLRLVHRLGIDSIASYYLLNNKPYNLCPSTRDAEAEQRPGECSSGGCGPKEGLTGKQIRQYPVTASTYLDKRHRTQIVVYTRRLGREGRCKGMDREPKLPGSEGGGREREMITTC
jgi:hypothetical protein